MRINDVFATAAKVNASDIYLQSNERPILRVKDKFERLNVPPLTPEACDEMILSSMNDSQREEFIQEKDFDYAINLPNIGRFRVNVSVANGHYEMVARLVAGTPKTADQLGLPYAINAITDEASSGLIVVTGATGSGKSSTLAAMIDRINSTKEKKIVTIEDPVEIVHTNKLSSISQRELYADTNSFEAALRAAMRQRPDVILVGEMRDKNTVATAIGASESGHLVLSTLHSVDAMETIGRILDFYPQDEQQQIRNLLSNTLRAVISQRLIVDSSGRYRPLVEVMTQTLRTAEAIKDPTKTHNLRHIMAESSYDNMQTFDSHLMEMVGNAIITPEYAIERSDKPDEMRRYLKNSSMM